MKHFDFADIAELAKTEPNKPLRLHWQSDTEDAEKTDPACIIQEISDGNFTAEQFDEIGYCITEEEYQSEQNETLATATRIE